MTIASYQEVPFQRFGTSLNNQNHTKKDMEDTKYLINTPQNIQNYTPIASGAIIGSYLHQDGILDRPLCSSRAEEFRHIFL